eukprot:UN24837
MVIFFLGGGIVLSSRRIWCMSRADQYHSFFLNHIYETSSPGSPNNIDSTPSISGSEIDPGEPSKIEDVSMFHMTFSIYI